MAWWNFERLHTDPYAGVTNLAYNGHYVWAVKNTTGPDEGFVRVYNIYGLDDVLSEVESHLQPEPNVSLGGGTVQLPTPGYFVTSIGAVAYVTAKEDPVYDHKFNKIYVVDLKYSTAQNPTAVEENIITINTPATMMSNIHYFYGKLWMVGGGLTDDEHTLHSYDLSS